MRKMTELMIFAAGVVIGSVATWKIAKTKYEQIAQEEIDSVKETYAKREERFEKKRDSIKSHIDEMDAQIRAMEMLKYVQTSDETPKEEKEEKNMPAERPYTIPPDEFGDLEDEGYMTFCLTYYADGILADEEDEIIDDIEESVGFDSLNRFGEYEEDAVHVRNDRKMADYEILRDERRYYDVHRSQNRTW